MKYLKKFNESDEPKSTETSLEIKRLQDEALNKSHNVALNGTKWTDKVVEYLKDKQIDVKNTKNSELLSILRELEVPDNVIYSTLDEVKKLF